MVEPKVIYLGHQVSHNRIEMVDDYVKKIFDSPRPSQSKELAVFMGVISYYRAFLPNLAKHTYHLNAERVPGSWNETRS